MKAGLPLCRRTQKNQAAELFAILKSNYKPLPCLEDAPEKYRSLTAYRMRAAVLGREATTVILYNPELEKGKKPTFESVSEAVSKVLGHREYMNDIFEYEILEKDNHIFLIFSDSGDKLNVIREEQLGKTALFTD